MQHVSRLTHSLYPLFPGAHLNNERYKGAHSNTIVAIAVKINPECSYLIILPPSATVHKFCAYPDCPKQTGIFFAQFMTHNAGKTDFSRGCWNLKKNRGNHSFFRDI